MKYLFTVILLLFFLNKMECQEVYINTNPEWSPDGTRIAFVSNRTGNMELYIVDSNGENLNRLTYNDEVDAEISWSPDGKKIAFNAREDKGKDFEIYTIDVYGKNKRQLTNNQSGDYTPSWSPDGTKIIFSSNRDYPDATDLNGNRELYIMDSDGENPYKITNLNSKSTTPVFSPDGKRIAFSSDKDGDYEIYVMNLEDKEIEQKTFNISIDWYPRWFNEKKLFYTSGSWDPYEWMINEINLESNEIKNLFLNVDSCNASWSSEKNAFLKSSNNNNGNSRIEVFYKDLDLNKVLIRY